MTMKRSARLEILESFRQNEAFFLLCVQVFVFHIGQSLIAPILPLYAQTFVLNTTMVGLLLTFQAVPRIFTSLPAGRLADRWGANRTIVAAAGIVTVSAVVGALSPNYTVLLISRVVQGIGTAISMTSGLTFAANISSDENRARHISLFQGSFLLGNSVGPVIGGYVAQYFGFRAPFYVYAVLSLLTGVWMFVRLPDSRSLGEHLGEQRKNRPGFIVSIRSMFGHPGVILASIIGFLTAYTRRGSRDMAIPLLGNLLGATEGQIGLSLTIIFLVTAIVLYWAGMLADRFGTKAVIVPSWLVTALGLVTFALAPQYSIFLIGAALFGLGAGIGAPIPPAYIVTVVDRESQGMAIGVFRTFNDLGLIFGPIIMGWIADRSGIASGVIVNAVLIIVVAVLFSFFAPDPENKLKVKEKVIAA